MKSSSYRNVIGALIAGVLTLSALPRAAAQSESTPPAAPAAPAPASERGAALRERMQATAAELGLTAEQKEKLTPVVRAEMEKVVALRDDKSLAPRQKIRKLKAIRDEAEPQVKAILTPEQYAKWQKKRANAREEFQERVRQRRKG